MKMRPGLRITHILGDGTTETHEDAQERLVKLHKLQCELFGELTSEAALVNRAFELQAERLACREETIET
jgi:1,2-phenylacetyl-CoA epoxidase catalytic subunit